jgi:hypothetical protein
VVKNYSGYSVCLPRTLSPSPIRGQFSAKRVLAVLVTSHDLLNTATHRFSCRNWSRDGHVTKSIQSPQHEAPSRQACTGRTQVPASTVRWIKSTCTYYKYRKRPTRVKVLLPLHGHLYHIISVACSYELFPHRTFLALTL